MLISLDFTKLENAKNRHIPNKKTQQRYKNL